MLHASLLVPSLSALAVLSASSLAEARLIGSFCSPAFIISATLELQSRGISLSGGGSVAICHHANKQYFLSV